MPMCRCENSRFVLVEMSLLQPLFAFKIGLWFKRKKTLMTFSNCALFRLFLFQFLTFVVCSGGASWLSSIALVHVQWKRVCAKHNYAVLPVMLGMQLQTNMFLWTLWFSGDLLFNINCKKKIAAEQIFFPTPKSAFMQCIVWITREINTY